MEEMPAEATIEEFAEVGRIAAKIREESRQLVNVGEGLLDIAETIEGMVREQGCDPAFPTNVSVNDIAAHYTPEAGDKTLLGEKDIVKVDLGVERNGRRRWNGLECGFGDDADMEAETAGDVAPGRHVGSQGEYPEVRLRGDLIREVLKVLRALQ